MKPRISVLMGIYNCAKTLPEALDSLYNQSYKDFKLILCDDGSIDDSYNIAKRYAAKYDNIILIQNKKNIKLAATLNHCLEYADTEYVARMDGDDISLPNRFEKQINFLDANLEYAVLSSPMILFDETGDWGLTKLEGKPNKESFKKGPPHSHAPCMVRTEVIKEVGGYTINKYMVRGQDYYLWYKIYKSGYTGYNLQEPLYKMRDDQDAMNRRTLRHGYNFVFVRREMFKGLEISYSLLDIFKPLIGALIPDFIKRKIRVKSLNIKKNLL
jgi:glycosyltransferase EpsE